MEGNSCKCNSSDVKNNDKLPEKVEEAIHRIIKKEGYRDYKVFTKALSTDGGNYFGSLYEVDVKGTTEDGDKETNIFVKGIVQGDNLTILSVNNMFTMELFMYNELSAVFDQLQDEADVPVSERYNVCKSFGESIHEAILLENVSRKGYKTVYRMDVVPLKFAQLSVQQLARFHGLSFALEKRRPDYFQRKIKSLSCPYKFNDDFKGLIRNSANAVCEILDNDAKRRLTNYLPKLFENVPRYIYEKKYKKCLVHNDYRPNNILMQEIDGEITDVIPVDYQLLYHGCPIIDFLYFIFLGTDQKFRENHLEDLKDLYFDSLTKILKRFDMDVKSVLTRDEFDDLYNELLDFGLFSFLQIMPFLFALEDEVPDLDVDYVSDIVIKTDPRMIDRARGVIDDFIKWGIL